MASQYSLTDKDCNHIYKSDYILKEYNAKRIVKDLGNVVIIGGGNVATDSARAAIRMGAKSSTIVYRRNKEKMPAREIELQEAIEDGVKIMYNTKVVSADVENGKINKINCIKTKLEDDKIIDIENSSFTLEADSIIFAIGLKPNKALIEKENIELNERGLIKTDENLMTNIEGVFAGGDVCQSKATVCMAIKAGKNADKNSMFTLTTPNGLLRELKYFFESLRKSCYVLSEEESIQALDDGIEYAKGLQKS